MSRGKDNNILMIGLLGAGLYFLTRNPPPVRGISGLDTTGCYYFRDGDDINNADELRKKFYKLSKKWHPDTGGSTEDFQKLQNEYEKLKYRLYTGQKYTKEEVDIETELDEALTAVYHSIMHLPGITIEVAGKWLWIGGMTYPVKTELKEAGLKFASQKKMWYFAGTEHRGKGKPMEMDSIRNKYGSTQLRTGGRNSLLSGPGEDLVLLIEKIKFLLTRRKKPK